MTTRHFAGTRPAASLPTFADLIAGRADEFVTTLAEWASIMPGSRRSRAKDGRGMIRWKVRGVRGVRLRTRRLGGRHIVLGADLRAFLEAVEQAAEPPAIPSLSAIARRRAHRAEAARTAVERALRTGGRS